MTNALSTVRLFCLGYVRTFRELELLTRPFVMFPALQVGDKYRITTPVNWNKGDDVIVHPSVSNEEAKTLFPEFKIHKVCQRLPRGGGGERPWANNRAAAVSAHHASQGRLSWSRVECGRRHMCPEVYYFVVMLCYNCSAGMDVGRSSSGRGPISWSPITEFHS